VSDLTKAGFSIRVIAEKLSAKKNDVEKAKKKLKEIATKGRS
jgi:hypothetical protein